ncbi:MAG: hypothetical protein U1F44_00405 [Coriobacteriia bacterium]|nr:hypothetical protein [Coriobacteriia bacterium]
MSPTTVAERIPQETLRWLTAPENPAVAVLTRRTLLGEKSSPDLEELWMRRNEYPPVSAILNSMHVDGSWLPPERDYKKYQGSLWQIHFLGELWACPEDERVQRAAAYAFSRQLDDGSWSCNGRPAASIPCLTANIGRALARLGFAKDPRVRAALAYITDLHRDLGYFGCRGMRDYALNGYCHMLTPKVLLFLAEIPQSCWPSGAAALRDACIQALRDKEIFRSLPAEYAEFKETVLPLPKAKVAEARNRFIAEHEPLHYKEKKGWLRFGYPLSYNSDALEALLALAGAGEVRRPEYVPAIQAVKQAADAQMRWALMNTFNGKMLADVEIKGKPSKWVTLRALQALETFAS